MKFSAFIEGNLDAIVADWEAFAGRLPAGQTMTVHPGAGDRGADAGGASAVRGLTMHRPAATLSRNTM